MKNETVSVLIGLYNIPSKEILEKALMSISNQTYKDLEIIIIDDGSTNDTYEWAKEITCTDSRVILKKNEKNLGLAKTLNRCLNLANGCYIARMDGDDDCSLDKISKQVKFLKEHLEYQLVSTNMACFDENGTWGSRINSEIITSKDFLFTSPIPHPTILTYRECMVSVGGYTEEKYAERNEDYDIFMRMFANGVKMYTLQEELYYYREDADCYSKRKYKYRLGEMVVRMKGFKILKLYPLAIPYIIKPLVVGILPQKFLRRLRNRRQRKHEIKSK